MYVKHLARCQAYLANEFQSYPARPFHSPCHGVTCIEVQRVLPLADLLADKREASDPTVALFCLTEASETRCG